MCVIQGLGCPVEIDKEIVVDLIDWESGVELRQFVNVSIIFSVSKNNL